MNTGTTCPHERSCHDYKSEVVALYVKCISLYGSLRGCEIAESLTEPDYDQKSASPLIHAALGSRLQSLSRPINNTPLEPR